MNAIKQQSPTTGTGKHSPCRRARWATGYVIDNKGTWWRPANLRDRVEDIKLRQAAKRERLKKRAPHKPLAQG